MYVWRRSCAAVVNHMLYSILYKVYCIYYIVYSIYLMVRIYEWRRSGWTDVCKDSRLYFLLRTDVCTSLSFCPNVV